MLFNQFYYNLYQVRYVLNDEPARLQRQHPVDATIDQLAPPCAVGQAVILACTEKAVTHTEASAS